MKRATSTTAINTYSLRRYWLSSLLLGIALPLSWTANADAGTVIFLTWSDSSIAGNVAVESYSQGDSNPVNLVTVNGRGTSSPKCGQITVTKQLDRSSPDFLGKVFEGSRTSASVPVTITFEKSTGADAGAFQYYKVQLFEVAVTSVTQAGAQGGDTVSESVSLEAARFRFTFTPQNSDGSAGAPVVFGWDCLANRAF